MPSLTYTDLNQFKGPPMKESLTSSQRVPIFRIYGMVQFNFFNKFIEKNLLNIKKK